MFRLEVQVIPFLNQFEVLECSASREELECVLIPETAENIQKLNEFLCFMNYWAIVPEHYAPAICEFLEYCHAEGAGTLDLAYLVYNYLNINTSCVSPQSSNRSIKNRPLKIKKWAIFLLIGQRKLSIKLFVLICSR